MRGLPANITPITRLTHAGTLITQRSVRPRSYIYRLSAQIHPSCAITWAAGPLDSGARNSAEHHCLSATVRGPAAEAT